MGRSVIYVVCHDAASLAQARADMGQYDWAHFAVVPDDPATSVFMESAAFLTVLPRREDEWRDADYVGILTWNAHRKIDVSRIDQCLQDGGGDIVAFVESREAMVMQVLFPHPQFLAVWLPLTRQLGISAVDSTFWDIAPFFHNYWVCKPEWMRRYLDFFARAVGILRTDSTIQKALWSPSLYSTHLSSERLMQIYGRTYMPYHPFVCERLPCLFFWLQGASIRRHNLKWASEWKAYFDMKIRTLAGYRDIMLQTAPCS